MARYAVGDIQGCYDALRRVLDQCGFDATHDELWLVGDLVNRGPQSLEVLRYVKSLGASAQVVLGNHDLHLLVVAAGHAKAHHGDTLDRVLAAPDRDELLDWLRHRSLMHSDSDYAIVHAGLLPQWSVAQALALAAEVESALRAADYCEFLRVLYGNDALWSDDLVGPTRLRVITNALTRLRLCTVEGKMEFEHKATPAQSPSEYLPWFEVPQRSSRDTPIIFGHWAALGLYLKSNVLGIDTGCVWGGPLTAIRLCDRVLYQYPAPGSPPAQPE